MKKTYLSILIFFIAVAFFCWVLPKQPEESVCSSVGLAASFESSLTPCHRQGSLAPDTKNCSSSLLNSRFFKLFQYKKTPSTGNCIHLPIRFFPFNDRPLVSIKIEKKNHSLLIDLGSNYPLQLKKKWVDQIKKKQPLGESEFIGIRGEKYKSQGYILPLINIQKTKIRHLTVHEENLDCIADAALGNRMSIYNCLTDLLTDWFTDGRIGWTFFDKACVFFDFLNQEIIIAKDFSMLQQETKIPFSTFTKASLEKKSYGFLVDAKTNFGSCKLFLDTGTTRSILRLSSLNDHNLNNQATFTDTLIIKGKNFGSLDFLLFEYTDKLSCDGILGMDFCKNRQICIDFDQQNIYIR